MDTKKCFKCGIVKPLSEFYKHPQMPDGHLNKCKECTKKDNAKNRKDKIKYYQEYDRKRANQPKRVKARKEYAEKCKLDENLKERNRQYKNKYRKTHKKEIRARDKLQYNLDSNKIEKPTRCQICGKETKLQAHHHDYNKPLDVIWVCDRCHKDIHIKLNKEKKKEL